MRTCIEAKQFLPHPHPNAAQNAKARRGATIKQTTNKHQIKLHAMCELM
jgi:hypothetical protein